ncbi:MAG: hypothetical protein AUG85_14700 [Gemmatimonadetes bacterium 13_1_20CM_4_66_11]|nr:MAG: hypothetical protein AUG85_14700 [Gemmatimonadetes bacterium 13_1_20CM_4_66_11]
MAYRHKLSCRLALLRDELAGLLPVAAAVTCERPVSFTGLVSSVARVVVVPESRTLVPAQQTRILPL